MSTMTLTRATGATVIMTARGAFNQIAVDEDFGRIIDDLGRTGVSVVRLDDGTEARLHFTADDSQPDPDISWPLRFTRPDPTEEMVGSFTLMLPMPVTFVLPAISREEAIATVNNVVDGDAAPPRGMRIVLTPETRNYMERIRAALANLNFEGLHAQALPEKIEPMPFHQLTQQPLERV